MIKQIQVGTEIVFWTNLVNRAEYKVWRKQIDLDFQEVESFKNAATNDARGYALKNNVNYEECLEFILEERSIECAFLNGVIQVYPTPFSDTALDICERYNLNIHRLTYGTSKYSQMIQNRKHDFSKIQQEILSLLPSASGTTFFAMDKNGNYIYKNKALSDVVGGSTSRVVSPKSWEISKKIMQLKKQMTVEEQHLDNHQNKHFLSVKAPLIIDGKVEGVMGVSIDITDRKKAEELELQNKLQQAELKEREKFQLVANQVAHDIKSPLLSLELALRVVTKKLTEQEYRILRGSAENIKKIMRAFLEYSTNRKEYLDYQHVQVSQAIAEIIERKKQQYIDENIEFHYSFDPVFGPIFIYGDTTSFERMMSNIINNSVESFEGRGGAIRISFTVEEGNVIIAIQDDGKGMPQEMVEKLMRGETVATTKVEGFGIGTGQVRDALEELNGRQVIESTPNVGTKITLIIPKSDRPV